MIPSGVRIFLCVAPMDMRLGFDRLAQVARDRVGWDPVLDAVEVFLDEFVGEVVPFVGVADDVLDAEKRGGGALVEPVEEFGDVVHRCELVRKVRLEGEEAHARRNLRGP